MKNLNVYLSLDFTLAKIYFEFKYSFKAPWINVILLISYSFYQSYNLLSRSKNFDNEYIGSSKPSEITDDVCIYLFWKNVLSYFAKIIDFENTS